MKAREPEKDSAPRRDEPVRAASERFVHLGSGCFLDRETGHVIVL